MSAFETARHQVAVAGRVTDARTARPMAGALVRIVTAPPVFLARLAVLAEQYGSAWATMAERPDQTVTAPDGHFHFLDLPNGQYAVAVSLPTSGTRYGVRSAQVSVARNGSGNLVPASADLTLPPTALEGQVTRVTGGPLPMAEVRVRGSDERAFSDGQGRYLLAPLEIGERGVVASAPGFAPVSRTVAFTAAGTSKTSDFTLTALAP